MWNTGIPTDQPDLDLTEYNFPISWSVKLELSIYKII